MAEPDAPDFGVIQLITVMGDRSRVARYWNGGLPALDEAERVLTGYLGPPIKQAMYAAEAVDVLRETADQTPGVVVLRDEDDADGEGAS